MISFTNSYLLLSTLFPSPPIAFVSSNYWTLWLVSLSLPRSSCPVMIFFPSAPLICVFYNPLLYYPSGDPWPSTVYINELFMAVLIYQIQDLTGNQTKECLCQ